MVNVFKGLRIVYEDNTNGISFIQSFVQFKQLSASAWHMERIAQNETKVAQKPIRQVVWARCFVDINTFQFVEHDFSSDFIIVNTLNTTDSLSICYWHIDLLVWLLWVYLDLLKL